MIWKTDWNAGDNHARNGTADMERLLANYNELKDILNTQFGFMVIFTTPPTQGYRTFAFQGLLNGVEYCMNALHVWTVEWAEKVVTWQAAGIGPNYEDINRWEKNGAMIEAMVSNVAAALRHSGTFSSGMEGLRL